MTAGRARLLPAVFFIAERQAHGVRPLGLQRETVVLLAPAACCLSPRREAAGPAAGTQSFSAKNSAPGEDNHGGRVRPRRRGGTQDVSQRPAVRAMVVRATWQGG